MNIIYCTPKILCNYFTTLSSKVDFVASYSSKDPNLNTYLKCYSDCTFIYCLTINLNKKQVIIYIGQSSNQYARMIAHQKKYDYDNIYLFSVLSKDKNRIEKEAIEHFEPLYNQYSNPKVYEKITSIGICLSGYKSKKQILTDLKLWKESYQVIRKTLNLPAKYVAIIQYMSHSKGIDENVFIEQILDNMFSPEIFQIALKSEKIDANRFPDLISTSEYGKKNNKSVEQIKVLCRNGRIPNAVKIGRDWMIPADSPYPKDRRNTKTVC